MFDTIREHWNVFCSHRRQAKRLEGVYVSSDSPENPRRARILIVDDNVDALEALSELLEIEGFAAVIAHNGLDALRHLEDGGISVVLLDLWMPVMNGPEFLRQKAEVEAFAISR